MVINFETIQSHNINDSEHITDHPGFEPWTLPLLAPRSTNRAVSDAED